MLNKFVILALTRTGSNMLVSTLGSHSQVFCVGELFKKELGISKKIRDRIFELNNSYADINYRLDNKIRFLDDVASLAEEGVKQFGFKLLLTQSFEFAAELVQHPDWKVLNLERDNALACFSSNEIAKRTGQGSARLKDEIIKAKAPFDKMRFERFMNRRHSLMEQIRDVMDKHPKSNTLQLKYATLPRTETFREIQEFLGLPIEDIQPQTKKRNSSVITSRFENEALVTSYLEENNLAHWIEE